MTKSPYGIKVRTQRKREKINEKQAENGLLNKADTRRNYCKCQTTFLS